MRRMRWRDWVGPIIVLGISLFVLSSYVTYSDYRTTMTRNGAWTVHFEGYLSWHNTQVDVTVNDFSHDFDPKPDLPGYQDWLGEMFSSGSPNDEGDPDAAEIFNIRITVISEPTHAPTQTLFDKKFTIRVGDIENDQLLSFNQTLGPYISHNSSYPVKLSLKIAVNGVTVCTESDYMTAPRMWY